MSTQENYATFTTAQLLGLTKALADKRESTLVEILYLLMIEYMPRHPDEFRQAIWDYLLKSTDEIEEIVTGLTKSKETEIDDFLASLEEEGEVKLADFETVLQATQRNLNTILEAELPK